MKAASGEAARAARNAVAVIVGATTAVFTANVAVPATTMSQTAGPSSIDDQAAAAGRGTGPRA